MSKVTTIITGADGKVTTIVTRRSGCGCLTILAAIVVFVAPAGFGAWAVPAYIGLGVLAVAYVAIQYSRIPNKVRRPTATRQPPSEPAPPPPLP